MRCNRGRLRLPRSKPRRSAAINRPTATGNAGQSSCYDQIIARGPCLMASHDRQGRQATGQRLPLRADACPSGLWPSRAAFQPAQVGQFPDISSLRRCPMTSPDTLVGGVSARRIAEVRAREAASLHRSPPQDRGRAEIRRERLSRWRADAVDEGLAAAFPDGRRRGEGRNSFVDIDGNRLDDFCFGDTGSMFGHSPAPVAKAIREQAERGLTYMLPTLDALEGRPPAAGPLRPLPLADRHHRNRRQPLSRSASPAP
jgi:hypothetical protein